MAFFLSLTHIGSRVKIYFLTHKSWKHRQSPLHSKAKFFFCSFGLNEALYGITSMSQPYNMVNYGVSQLLTNVIKHKGITTTLAKCVTRCKHSICSLWHFLLCIFTTHPPPPSSLFHHMYERVNLQNLVFGVHLAQCDTIKSTFLRTKCWPDPQFYVFNFVLWPCLVTINRWITNLWPK